MSDTMSEIETIRADFEGFDGAKLAARIDRPRGHPKAVALFAHCFTCGKDLRSANRIAQTMAQAGFVIMRFDFTGLGSSEGEFASTNFTTNILDLHKAVAFLSTEYSAPSILIGHSLGGAAVLAIARDIPEVVGVATIGAPANTDHVVHNFGVKIEEIETEGEAEVILAGRKFRVRRQFLDDIRNTEMEPRIMQLRKALLVLHAPQDETVGIENAGLIFAAARHPKSFISLDGADHLLTRNADAVFVAKMVAAWGERYTE